MNDGTSCEAVYQEILAAEQMNPMLARWHTVVVCAYLLQHPSQGQVTFLDAQFRILQLYRDKGLDALLRFSEHQRARNRHSVQSGYDMAPLVPYTPLPAGSPPARFLHGFHEMRDLVGRFGHEGFREYERRLDTMVDATIAAWLRQ